MGRHLRLILCLIVLWPSALMFAQKPSRNLSKENWQFSIGASKITFNAKVPGCQYTDMLNNQLIVHPFMGNNEDQLQDIAKFPIIYQCTFKLSKDELKNPKICLLFKGLDTYAKVYLNGQFILNANNMHRSWECEVKSLLKLGLNSLIIRFEPIADITKDAASSVAYTLPGGEYVWVRKAAYQFGWDWAPRFLTAGIWKDIELVFQGDNQLKSFQFKVLNLHDTLAQLSYQVQLDKPATKRLKLSLVVDNSSIKKSIVMDSGQTTATVLFNIPNPKLWWCNGMGAPHLYQAKLQLFDHHKLLDQASTQFGIRTIEWVQHPDDSGSSFYLKLNGFPIFMKGANWVPLHSFLTEIKPEQYAHQIKLASLANLNMLRVWGGGIYESDAFYEQCDANGILVWQDFMFACAMYPGDTAFTANVAKEAEEQIIRLRNHPSLALWCGNNESDEGWHNWGWQKQYSYTLSDSSEIWHAYQSLFHQLLPNLISSLDAGRYYHPSSPANGWGRAKAYKTGDVHYWGVWWGDEPFTKYDEKVGRFVSEYGFQGFPSLELLKKWVPNSRLHLDSAALKAHQKHPRGFELIRSQLAREGYLATDSLMLFAQQSAKLQAMGMERAIDAHRRNMPYCMGSLFWQWNDCWPAISWSAIDYEGTPKPVYEAIQRAFKPIRQQAFLADGLWKFGIVSDRYDTVKLKVKLTINNSSGETRVNGSWDIALTWGFNEQVFFEPDLLTRLDFSEPCLLTIELMEENKKIDQRTYTFIRKSVLEPIEILNLYHDN